MSGEFIINDDQERGVKVIGSFTPEGKIHVKVLQYVPDAFFDTIKAMREQFANRKKGTQSHYQPLPIVPHVLADQLFRDGNGQMLALNDPERDKRWKSLQNDISYRNLRVSEGKV